MSIKDRFKMIMDREKLTAGAFAESIGVAQATISHILGPRNKYPSTEVILRLHQRYNDINLEWLLTGQGEMSNTPSDSDSSIESGFDYPLFAENSVNPSKETGPAENRKEIALETPVNATKEIVKQEIIYKEELSFGCKDTGICANSRSCLLIFRFECFVSIIIKENSYFGYFPWWPFFIDNLLFYNLFGGLLCCF